MILQGSFTALVTPLRQGTLDLEGLAANVQFQLEHGTAGLVPAGSTGEAPTLDDAEWEAVVATVVKAAEGRVPVFAGTGTYSTRRTENRTRRARELGANGALVVCPYYNKPSQEGLYRHFRAVGEAAGLPMMVYNIPGRTGVNLLPATLERLARDCPLIVAVKEASGSLDQVSEIVERLGPRLTVFSGDDSLTLPILTVGGKGVVSVLANIVPADIAQFVKLFLFGEIDEAQHRHARLYPLARAMFIETNPGPVKAAMEMLGMPAGELRLPLTVPGPESLEKIRSALRAYGLIK